MVSLEIGHHLLWIAAVVTALVAILSAVGVAARDRRYVLAARTGIHAQLILLAAASAILVHGFVAGVYNNEYIYNYSERGLLTGFKLAGLWAGLDGSLLFWTMLLGGVSSIAALGFHRASQDPVARRLEPWTYVVLAVITGFFVALSIEQNPFSELDLRHRLVLADRSAIPMDARGNLLDGHGLNPQLVNYWFVIHPPCLYLGFVTFAVPFAIAVAALITGELGGFWVRMARRWALVAWILLTSGIILGGLWAYRQLGWGGYWAWDPVENASFLPWCTATAFLHSLLIQQRRNMLKGWTIFLIIFTFFLTIEATYMTRSGEVASVHSFAGGGSIGTWFRLFKFLVTGSALFLLFLRARQLRGANRLESVWSREAAFYLSNLVLVAICLAVWFLSWWPNNSAAYLGAKKTIGESYYNLVITPLFVILLTLTALGPTLAWVRTPAAALRRRLVGPLLFAFAFTGMVYVALWSRGDLTSFGDWLVPKPLQDALYGKSTEALYHPAGLYPTGILLFLCAWIVGTVGAEFLRAVGGRRRVAGLGPGRAALDVLTRDNRRYGGYLTHVGVAILTTGIVISSMFKVEEKFQLRVGESARIGPYTITPTAANRSYRELNAAVAALRSGARSAAEIEPGHPYLRDEVRFRVERRPQSTLPTAHGAASSGAAREGGTREIVCELRPERRFYPKQDQWISEVSIHRMLRGDIYLYYVFRDNVDRVYLTVYLNPLMVLIWLGWFVIIGGGVYAALPLSRKKAAQGA